MFVKICSAVDPLSAEVLRDLLEVNGFHPLDLRTSSHVMIAGVDHSYFVEVPESEATAARECLIENDQIASVIQASE